MLMPIPDDWEPASCARVRSAFGPGFTQPSCGRGASCARSGVSSVEDHGLAVRVGGAVHGLVGDFAFGGFRQGELSLRRGTCCVRVDLAGLVALVCLPVRVRAGNRTIAVFAIIHKPLELGLVVGLPVCTCGSHLAARQRLRQAIST